MLLVLLLGIAVAVVLYLFLYDSPLKQAFHRMRVRQYFTDYHPFQHSAHSIAHVPSIPPAHTLLTCDFRVLPLKPLDRPLRIASWNIEFGYQLSGVINALQHLDADILLLQEVDIISHDARGLHKSVFHAIAEALEYTGVFAGHHKYDTGVWGCAILSRFTLVQPHQVVFTDIIEGYGRSAIGAQIDIPNHAPVLVYSAHLEVCAGISNRLDQFSQVLDRIDLECKQLGPETKVCIAGDLNTVGHGLARFSPFHCIDEFRWKSLGYSEAQWWREKVFQHPEQLGYGYHDPFEDKNTLTHALHSGKLDWILLKNFTCKPEHALILDAANSSDHKLICCAEVD